MITSWIKFINRHRGRIQRRLTKEDTSPSSLLSDVPSSQQVPFPATTTPTENEQGGDSIIGQTPRTQATGDDNDESIINLGNIQNNNKRIRNNNSTAANTTRKEKTNEATMKNPEIVEANGLACSTCAQLHPTIEEEEWIRAGGLFGRKRRRILRPLIGRNTTTPDTVVMESSSVTYTWNGHEIMGENGDGSRRCCQHDCPNNKPSAPENRQEQTQNNDPLEKKSNNIHCTKNTKQQQQKQQHNKQKEEQQSYTTKNKTSTTIKKKATISLSSKIITCTSIDCHAHHDNDTESLSDISSCGSASSNDNTISLLHPPQLPMIATIRDSNGYRFVGDITKGTAEKGKGVFCHVSSSSRSSTNDDSSNVDNGLDSQQQLQEELQEEEEHVAVYRGDFEHGLFHGQGMLRDADGTTYTGNFQYGNRHGHGRESYPDGQLYVGEFRHDAIHGFGTCHYPDGSIYRGDWVDDLKHGTGQMTKANGVVLPGHWDHDSEIS